MGTVPPSDRTGDCPLALTRDSQKNRDSPGCRPYLSTRDSPLYYALCLMPVDLQTFTADHGALVARLWHCCTAARWGIALDAFGSMLHESVAHRFADSRPSEPAVDAYLASLHLDDLCLTRACADGNGQAWDEFVATHRPRLYAAARAIAGDDGRELADSLYGELYGITGTADGRKSLCLL